MKIRLAAYLQPDSIVDGEGIRTVIWTQGCPHHCEGCHNPETHDVNSGALIDVTQVCDIIDTLEGQDGITFSGGDPFMQPKECAYIAKYVRSKGYNIWAYTGYTFEQIISLSKSNSHYMEFLREIDILIDGKFQIENKTYDAAFRGSSNQRIIDVRKSLECQRVVISEKYETQENMGYNSHPVGVYI